MKTKEYTWECSARGRWDCDAPLKMVYVAKAPNGREVAECKSETMVRRIVKGLNMEAAERKRKRFLISNLGADVRKPQPTTTKQ